ncbi:MAG TPA: type VII secretion protein EccB [Micromonosporaceae bacterium]
MASRQDELQSYQFTMQRVVAALVARDTDPLRSPSRRLAGASLASVLVAVLSLAAVAVYGVIVPGGGTSWRDSGAVIVERESGARYVYLDNRLHPVLNYASALLILQSDAPRTVRVPRASLAGVPRGVPLGIPGAPDSLPDPTRLLGTPWTVCSEPAPDRPRSLLWIGGTPPGGQRLDERGLLVEDGLGSVYLVWHRHRHLVRDPAVVLTALGWRTAPRVRVAAALVNALPAGPDLARLAPAIARLGRPSTVARARIGQVFVVQTPGGEPQYAVALADGLAPISQVQADLLLADPDTARLLRQDRATPLPPGEYAVAPVSATGLPDPGARVASDVALPAGTPALVGSAATQQATCAVVGDPAGVADVLLGVPVGEAPTALPTGGAAGAVLADRVVVPPGGGALVEAAAGPGAQGGTLSLVTDLGIRYPVPNRQVLAMLGFPDARPVRVPAGLVTLLPVGRTLDPDTARRPASISG